MWLSKSIQLPPKSFGFHWITAEVVGQIPEISTIAVGLLHLSLQHTSASLSLNENTDPRVLLDLRDLFRHLVAREFPFRHDDEGPDDMPAHVLCAMMGTDLTIPIRDGSLALGTWQGIVLGEHRDRASGRVLLATMHGQPI